MRELASIRREIENVRSTVSMADAALIDLLLGRFIGWRDDNSSARKLLDDADRILGNIWLSIAESHAALALALARLRDIVTTIDGMTMNERLFTFDLVDRWDRSTADQRDILYAKLHARR